MKTTTVLAAAALAAVVAIGGCQSNDHKGGHHDDDAGDATEMRMNASDVPANVRQAFERQFPQARVSEVNKETYHNGTVHYEYEFVDKDGKSMEVEFDEDGQRLPDH